MITVIILSCFLAVVIIGFIQIFNKHSQILKRIDFAGEYRNKFVEFSNKYFKTRNPMNRKGDLDGDLYVWLTMNVSKIQNHLGSFGIISYKPAFQNYIINNYPVIINTIPKFRDGNVDNLDVGSVDDCLLRYIGNLEEILIDLKRNFSNPIIWFREGFREVFSIPIFILNWFGVISTRTLNSIKESLIYKIISGLIALVTLVSGVVTIIVGYNETLKFINSMLGIE
ncbi:MAG: hypothetical protein CMB99_14935 [Flavobacteriaceae bacterium]|nr:hypothetical protein [Flavobacteriaceae bacterium]|tara:strand:+ start:281031 stop:281708 length:678 start_codon:yes stop_codon:yes gene_type:complete